MSSRTLAAGALLVAIGLSAGSLAFQPNAPDSGLTLLSPDGRREIPTTRVDGREMIALSLLADLFGLSVFEDALAGGLTVSRGDRTIVLAPGQTLASVGGRLVSLPAPASRGPDGWLVPLAFVDRALALIVDTPLDLRVDSRLLVVGDLRVPRVVVRHQTVGQQARLTIDTAPGTPSTVRQEADRLVVEFEADRLDATLPLVPAGPIIGSIGLGDRPTSLAVELGPAFAAYDASESTGPAGGTRLTLDLRPAGVETTAAAPTPDPSAAGGLDSPGSTGAPVPLLGPERRTLETVVIDPGHGGDDVGARGESGTLEKDVTLAVARRLRSMIESRLGLRVVLTRSGDQTVRLDERAAVANNTKAGLFLSLHANASPQPTVAGAEVFFLSADEYGTEAQRRASTPAPVLPVFGGGRRSLDLVRWDMAQMSHLTESSVLARTVADRLGARVPMSERALLQAPFRVLAGANMPAVLVEMGFMTNPAQETAMASGRFQNSVAQALFESVVRFRAHLESRP